MKLSERAEKRENVKAYRDVWRNLEHIINFEQKYLLVVTL